MARYIGVMLLAALVLWTGEARGACAWVLWQQTRTWGPRPPATDSWEILQTFETRAECESARLPEWRSSDDAPGLFTAARDVCYPDTIDPRGPKVAK